MNQITARNEKQHKYAAESFVTFNNKEARAQKIIMLLSQRNHLIFFPAFNTVCANKKGHNVSHMKSFFFF